MLAISTRTLSSQAEFNYLKKFSNQAVNGMSFARGMVAGLSATTRITVLFCCLLAIIAIASVMIKPELAYKIHDLPLLTSDSQQKTAPQVPDELAGQASTETKSMESVAVPAPSTATTDLVHLGGLSDHSVKPTDNSRQQQWVTNWLSKRYRVAGDATGLFVTTAYNTARETKLDPLLILAVMAIESGLNPFAESPVGAQGLMQVMSKVHEEKFDDLGGIKAALNPAANIKVGSMILKDYVTQGGSIEAGLKRYVGAAAFATDGGYGYKVLAEYRRLQDVATGKNVPSSGSVAPIATPKLRPIVATSPTDATQVPVEAETSTLDAIEHPIQQSSTTNKRFTSSPLT